MSKNERTNELQIQKEMFYFQIKSLYTITYISNFIAGTYLAASNPITRFFPAN